MFMIRGFALVGIVLVLSIVSIQAKTIEVGDNVTMVTDFGPNSLAYVGTITDIGEGLIGMNCSYTYTIWPSKKTVDYSEENREVVLGVCSIRSIYWN